MPLTPINYNQIKGAVVNALDYGVSTSAADNGAAILAAIVYCAANGKTLFFPAGTYNVTTAIVSTVICSLEGERGSTGENGSSIKWNGAAGSTLLRFNLAAPVNYIILQNMQYESNTTNKAVTLVQIVGNASGVTFANTAIEGCSFIAPSDYALIIDGTIPWASGSVTTHTSMYFASNISNCLVQGGIKILKGGDSLVIQNNNISRVDGITTSIQGLYITGANGAVQKTIRDNNITTLSGAIYLQDCSQCTVENNQIEFPFSDSTANFDHTVNGDSLVWIKRSNFIKIERNNLQTGGASIAAARVCLYPVLFDSDDVTVSDASADVGDKVPTQGCTLKGNNITYGRSDFGYYAGFVNKAFATVVGNNYYVATNTPNWDIQDANAYPQIGIRMQMDSAATPHAPTPVLQGTWIVDNSQGNGTLWLQLGEDGWARWYGQLKNASVQAAVLVSPAPCVNIATAGITPAVNTSGVPVSDGVTVFTVAAGAGGLISIPTQGGTGTTGKNWILNGLSYPYYLSF